MSNVINAGEPVRPMTAQEFEAFLEVYKAQNPEKFAIKEAKGEFDRFRKNLPLMPNSFSEQVEEVEKEETTEVRRGRPRKE